MSVLEFADSNIVVYAVGLDSEQRNIARQIIADRPAVSAQVINEVVSVLTRKQSASLRAAHEVAESLLDLCEVAPVDQKTIRKAIDLATRCRFPRSFRMIVSGFVRSSSTRTSRSGTPLTVVKLMHRGKDMLAISISAALQHLQCLVQEQALVKIPRSLKYKI